MFLYKKMPVELSQKQNQIVLSFLKLAIKYVGNHDTMEG